MRSDATTFPALRSSVVVWQQGDTILHFIDPSSRKLKSFDIHPRLASIVPLLDGEHSRESLHRAVEAFDDFEAGDLDEALATLAAEGLLSTVPVRPGDEAWVPERYDRQARFFSDIPGFVADRAAPDMQALIASTTVLVVGLGGAGTATTSALAAAGIGRLRLCDPKRVHASNLARQIIYRPGDLGRPKAEAAADWVRRFNPDVRADAVVAEVGSSTDLETMAGPSDIIVNCADVPNVNVTAGWASRAARNLGVPCVNVGGYAVDLAVIGPTIIPGRTPCWECITTDSGMTAVDAACELVRPPTGPAGSIAMVSAVAGNLAAWEVVRLIITGGGMLEAAVCEVDFRSLQTRMRRASPTSLCAACAREHLGSSS